MQSSKLITMVKCLDEQEFKALGRFVRSPYFNTKSKITALYDYMSKSYPDFEVKRMNKKSAWPKLFPGKTFQAKKMNDLMSELTVLVQKFMAVDTVFNDEVLLKSSTALAFGRKGIFPFFVDELKKIERAVDEQDEPFPLGSLIRYLMKKEEYYHPLSPKAPPAGKILEEASKYLDEFFLSNKLKLILESQLRNRIFSEQNDLSPELDQLEKSFNLEKHEYILVRVYYRLILVQLNNDFELLSEIERNLDEWLIELAKEDRAIVIYTLINQVSQVYHSGNPDLVEMLLQLFKHGLKEQIFLLSDRIKHTTFLNIALIAAAAGDFDFFDAFVKDHEENLSEVIRSDTICLAYAYCFFYKGAYDEAIGQLLGLSHSRKPEFELRLRNLEIRCFFEKMLRDDSYRDLFFAKTQSFGKYLTRSDLLSEVRMEGYRNFVRITGKIARALYALKLNDRKKAALLEELEGYQTVVSFNWIKEKVIGE